MDPTDLLNKLCDHPFKPFRVHLSDGSEIDVVEPGMVIVSDTSAVLPDMWAGKDDLGRPLARHWRTIALDQITQFVDLPIPRNGKNRSRKK